jgi:hypothetical protein
MKKIIFILLSVFFIGTTSFAQDQAKAPSKKMESKKTNGTEQKQTKLKKDGTPDMRHAENKKAAAGPMKKDGTPDMRYKANKKPLADKKK